MAEQKIEETKPAVPRRVARPFIGPAGAGSAARSPLRPAAPTDRPRPAAFGPPVAPSRPSLGVAEADPVSSAPVPAVPLPLPARVPTPAAVLPVVEIPQPTEGPEIPEALNAESSMDIAASDVPYEVAYVPTPPAVPPVRPVTSEMVAIDAFDAFEAAWSAPEITGAPDTFEAASASIDELSLGGGLDGPHMWTEEITAAPEEPISQPIAQSTAHPVLEAIQQSIPPENEQPTQPANAFHTARAEPSPSSSDAGVPAWLADDAEPVAEPVASTEASFSWPEAYAIPPEAPVNEVAAESVDGDNQWPDPLLAEYAPYIPTPSSVSTIPTPASIRAVVPGIAHEPHVPTEESADTTTAQEALGSPIEALSTESIAQEKPAHEVRVSAALDRLAERVRSGEIDVSSVAAEASDAALLASVLAALLGGSSSR